MAIDNTTALMPCPFCGNRDVLFLGIETEDERTRWVIVCKQCNMMVRKFYRDSIIEVKSPREDLAWGWNKRPRAGRR